MEVIKGVTVNKLSVEQYKALKQANGLVENECYVLTDIDEYLDSPIKYIECLDVSNPIIIRNLSDGIYKIFGYFKFNEAQTGISGADPYALLLVASSSTTTYANFISYDGNQVFTITDTTYQAI